MRLFDFAVIAFEDDTGSQEHPLAARKSLKTGVSEKVAEGCFSLCCEGLDIDALAIP